MTAKLLTAILLTSFCFAAVLHAEPNIPDCAPCFSVDPGSINFPIYGKPGVPIEVPLTITNASSLIIFRQSVEVRYDSTFPSTLPKNWIGSVSSPTAMSGGSSEIGSVILNPLGNMTELSSVMYGRLIFTYAPPEQVDTVHIRFMILDTVIAPKSDTVTTSCISLVVSTNGNMGRLGAGGVNMNFSPVDQGGIECDTSTQTSRGNAGIYLFDGSPVILRQTGSNVNASWSLYNSQFSSLQGLRPVLGAAVDTTIDKDAWTEIHSGTFVTADSLLQIDKSWYAPKDAENCQFIVQRMRVTAASGVSVPGLAIGEWIDWNVPTDSGLNFNTGGYDATHNLLWQRGYDKNDGALECADNSERYAGTALLFSHLSSIYSLTNEPYAGYVAKNTDLLPGEVPSPDLTWQQMQTPGYSATQSTQSLSDLHSAFVYKNVAGTGWTLPANDTLTVWTAMAVTYQAENTAAGLDSLKSLMDRARKFASDNLGDGRICCCCGTGTRGNLNEAGIVDIADLTLLVAYLTLTEGRPSLSGCNANLDGQGIVDISDLTLLIAYLAYVPRPALPPCP